MNVLVVDDDYAIRESLDRSLRANGFEVELANDGNEALLAIEGVSFDVVVLDILMPGRSGIDVCHTLRAAGNRVPILMLTARDTVADRVAGLEAGGDDYLVKPFALEELIARLRALVRRTTADVTDTVLRFADLSLDRRSLEVHRGGRRIELPRMQLLLLELFLLNPRQVLPRSLVYERVWGYDFGGSSNSLDVHLSQLRHKLEDDGEPRLIHTVRGMGYILREQ
ncbi:MAG TPA: response regulator transcription factor [Gaiellaceae bacterium]|nr:response regulator transcription factor [Gaiellaceae bacterium]